MSRNLNLFLANKAKYEGEILQSNSGDLFEIVSYEHSSRVKICFLESGFTTYGQIGTLIRGGVRDKSKEPFYNILTLDTDEPKYTETREYQLWKGMSARCYYNGVYNDRGSTYKGCTMSDNFKIFSFFREWCDKQVGYSQQGWHLDKDIIQRGNRVYSEDTCAFVPVEINSLILTSKKSRGDYPIGVTFDKERNKFQAQVWIGGKGKYLGRFDSADEAFLAYKVAKESHIKAVAEFWKDSIDSRVYESLLAWTVKPDD